MSNDKTNLKYKTAKCTDISIKNGNLVFIDITRNTQESILLKDIKRIEILDKVGLVVDSWGEEIIQDEKKVLMVEVVSSLDKIQCEFFVFVYMENNQVKSKRLASEELSLIKIEEDGVFIDDTFMNNSSIFYIVPLIEGKIKDKVITINDYIKPCIEGESTFTNPNCFIKQFF